ncbi:MAG: DNA repair protein RecO [Clostridia bacterium]|nr:DNA repair protein RecO [Clostridia bacterium]
MTCDGLVIRVTRAGETDRVLQLLTPDNGVVMAYARAAGRPKSRLQSATSLFSYSTFSLYERREGFTVDSAEVIRVFSGLSRDISALALGQYFCSVCSAVLPENAGTGELLRLVLNSLHFLETGEKDERLLKAVFELRAAAGAGFMPDLVGCETCGRYESPLMAFDISKGCVYCDEHAGQRPRVELDVISAARLILFSPLERIWSFSLPEQKLAALGTLSESWLLASVGHPMRTLDYYKSLKNIPTDG